MVSLCKIASKCLILLKKCILALYCAVFLFISYYFLKVHAISHYEHITGAHESLYSFDMSHQKGSLLEWLFMISTFVVMNLALIGLCANWVFAPISLAVHLTVPFGKLFIRILAELNDPYVVPTKRETLYAFGFFFSIFGFFETVSIWLAYDLYKMKLKKNSVKKATEGDAQIVYHKMVDDNEVVVVL